MVLIYSASASPTTSYLSHVMITMGAAAYAVFDCWFLQPTKATINNAASKIFIHNSMVLRLDCSKSKNKKNMHIPSACRNFRYAKVFNK